MKNFKKIWALLLLTTATGYIQTAGEEQEYNPETSVFADNKAGETFRAEEREKELHKIEPDKQQEAEEIPLKVKPNWLTKQFDKISNWSNKRTLNKMFTENAKNDSTNKDGILTSDGTKNMWKNLSTKDQQDLINQWSKNRKDQVTKELARDQKKYTDALNAYKLHGQRETFAKIENAKNEIKKNNQTIAKLEQKITEKTSDTEKKLIKQEINSLQALNETQDTIKKNYLELIENELTNRDKTHTENQKFIIDAHIQKVMKFVDSINALQDSTVEVNNTQISAKTTDRTELTKEEELKKLVDDTSGRAMTPEELQRMKDLKEQLFGNTEETPASLATEETEIKSLSDQQIQNLSDYELTNMINQFVDNDPRNFDKNPEYQKLDIEEKRRNAEERNRKSKESVLKYFADRKTNETASPSFPNKSEDLEVLKRKAQNWSLTRIKEEMLDSKYSKAELEYLKAEAKSLEK